LIEQDLKEGEYRNLFYECIMFLETRVYIEFLHNNLCCFIPYIDFFNHDPEADVTYIAKSKENDIIFQWRYSKELEVVCL
jgi:hypothetical protein